MPERSFSVRLGDRHRRDGAHFRIFETDEELKPFAPTRLILKSDDGMWWLYYLNSEDKVQGALQASTLEAAQGAALRNFGVLPGEWIEDAER